MADKTYIIYTWDKNNRMIPREVSKEEYEMVKEESKDLDPNMNKD